jgi:Phage integrase family
VQPSLEGHCALYETLGMPPRTIHRLVKHVLNRAHIRRPVRPHVLRHTFSVTAMQKDISLPALQRLLGYDRLTPTEIYLHLCSWPLLVTSAVNTGCSPLPCARHQPISRGEGLPTPRPSLDVPR